MNLSVFIGRTVVDRTGFMEAFDYDLTWMPDLSDQGRTDADLALPSLFTALQEQLGLKLEATKGAVNVLVIDHAEKPAPD